MASKRSTDLNLEIKRIYEGVSSRDGDRILVDRIWPRGVSKEDASLALWMKEIAPSTPLRKWFGHEPERWTEFEKRYRKELIEHDDLVAELLERARRGKVTLVYSAKDEEHNQAVALSAYLRDFRK